MVRQHTKQPLIALQRDPIFGSRFFFIATVTLLRQLSSARKIYVDLFAILLYNSIKGVLLDSNYFRMIASQK